MDRVASVRGLLGASIAVVVACAPVVDGPAARARGADRADEQRLAAQLLALPGAVRSEVMIRRPIRDPLDVAPPADAALSIVLVVDDHADRATTLIAAERLAAAAAPGIDPAIIVEVGAVRPQLASLGPFTVEASSRRPLKVALALVFGLVALLAGAIAWRTRPGSRSTPATARDRSRSA